MSRHFSRYGWKTLLASAFALWIAALVTVRANVPDPVTVIVEKSPPVQNPPQSPPAPTQQPQPAQTGAPAADAKYVGEDTCLTCHDTMVKGYKETPHGRKLDTRSPAATQGCESCHGPGSKHVDDPAVNKLVLFSPKQADQSNAQCVSCHNRGEHALWDGSQHETRKLACVTCHSVHNYKSEVGQLKEKTQRDLCATCHRDKISKLDRSGHMPVREGKMQCTTCHNVHGATNVRLLRKGDSIAESCTSCHADKRGPFLWEHAPSRDGCVTCHDPHGSMNERMLVSKPPILCQRCHVATRHPATIYDQAAIAGSSGVRVFARSCVTCHSAIHGSNHPSGQRFVR